MRAFTALLFLGPAACDEPPPTATLQATPTKFVGTWDVSVEACKAAPRILWS